MKNTKLETRETIKEIPKYLNVNVRRLRKCPQCKKTHYERRLESVKVIRVNNGIIERSYSSYDDAGSTWQCLECNLHIYQDGSWELIN